MREPAGEQSWPSASLCLGGWELQAWARHRGGRWPEGPMHMARISPQEPILDPLLGWSCSSLDGEEGARWLAWRNS